MFRGKKSIDWSLAEEKMLDRFIKIYIVFRKRKRYQEQNCNEKLYFLYVKTWTYVIEKKANKSTFGTISFRFLTFRVVCSKHLRENFIFQSLWYSFVRSNVMIDAMNRRNSTRKLINNAESCKSCNVAYIKSRRIYGRRFSWTHRYRFCCERTRLSAKSGGNKHYNLTGRCEIAPF